jgi:hypothetical protein
MRVCYLSQGKLAPPKSMVPAMVNVAAAALAASLVRRSQTTHELVAQGFELDSVRQVAEVRPGLCPHAAGGGSARGRRRADGGQDITECETALSEKLVDAVGWMLKMDAAATYPTFESAVLGLYAPVLLDAANVSDLGALHNCLCVFVDAVQFGPHKAELVCVARPRVLPCVH